MSNTITLNTANTLIRYRAVCQDCSKRIGKWTTDKEVAVQDGLKHQQREGHRVKIISEYTESSLL